MAERNLFLSMAKILWGFHITPGNFKPDSDPVTGYCEGFLVCANDFEAEFEVRSERRKQTILREFDGAKAVFEKYELTGDEKA